MVIGREEEILKQHLWLADENDINRKGPEWALEIIHTTHTNLWDQLEKQKPWVEMLVGGRV